MTNPIIPKIAYISIECKLSVDKFLKMWEEETSGQEGEPTQKDYDTFLRSLAEDYFYDLRGEIENNIRLIESNVQELDEFRFGDNYGGNTPIVPDETMEELLKNGIRK
jgi:hypothetical protein